MEMEKFDRVADMTDGELVRWSFVLWHLRQIEDRLASLAAGFVPSPELAAAQEALTAEIAKRTIAKGATA